MSVKILVIGLFALAAASLPARPAAAGSMYIQLPPLLAPVVLPNNERRNGAVTVVLTVIDRDHVGEVCRMMPRINNALLQTWYREPLEWSTLLAPPGEEHRGVGLARYEPSPARDAEEERLVGVLNAAVGARRISRILIFQGTKAGARGSLRCSELDELGKKAAKKAHGGGH